MKIKNFDELSISSLHRIALELLEEGLVAADPYRAVKQKIRVGKDVFYVEDKRFEFNAFKSIYVVGCGKASEAMAKALEDSFGDRIEEGVVLATERKHSFKRIEVLKGSHPIPSKANVDACRKIVEVLEKAGSDDLIFCLISGGGSALMCFPYEQIPLDDLSRLTKLLLQCGAGIREINTIRKHVEVLKGGKLAKLAYPAQLICLILSDVVGDHLEFVASGPTTPDSTTFSDCLKILRRYSLLEKIPGSVKNFLEAGLEGKTEETLKRQDPVFDKVLNVLVGSNKLSLRRMKDFGERQGFNAFIVSSRLEGEAREVGEMIGSIAKQVKQENKPFEKPAILLFGGETTVTLKDYTKRGGRNQELALSVALAIKGLEDVVVACLDSDGKDGNSDAAGALVDGGTVTDEILEEAKESLEEHSSYDFFKKIGRNIFTGSTGTNVNDFVVCVVK